MNKPFDSLRELSKDNSTRKEIIFDETNGQSIKGRFFKRLAKNRDIKYVTTIKEFLEGLRKNEEVSRNKPQ